MVDKITKALSKFSASEKELVKKMLLKIKSRKFDSLDLKKLKGRSDIYRVRKGKVRIMFRLTKEEIYILAIEKRNEKTYKNSN